MRRKLTAALLTAAMAISLTACGGSGDTASAGASTGETASVTEAGATTTASGKEVLRVAMSADYAPFDWLQEDDSNGAVMTSNGSYMNGYDVLVAKYIAEKLDMDLEITQIDWDGLILSIQSKKFLHFDFYRKTVGIPSGFPWNVLSFHGLESRNHILDGTCLYMSDMWFSVCRRRSVIKCVHFTFSAVVYTFPENVIILPELFNFFFSVYELHVRRNFLINHCSFLSCLVAYIF